MIRINNSNIVFLIDDSTIEYGLSGQQMIINTRYLMMMEYSCTIEIQNVKRIKNRFFGNENLFNTVITGPGKIILQTCQLAIC